jgi:hypothetical protein
MKVIAVPLGQLIGAGYRIRTCDPVITNRSP